MKLYVVDFVNETVSPPRNLRTNLSQTIAEFKQLVSIILKVPTDSTRLVIEKYYNALRLLDQPNKMLQSESFGKSTKVTCSPVITHLSLGHSSVS